MKRSVLFETEDILSTNRTKREYMNMISDVKDSHSRKYIYQMKKCNYVVSQNGTSHCRKRKIDRRNEEAVF